MVVVILQERNRGVALLCGLIILSLCRALWKEVSENGPSEARSRVVRFFVH